MKHPKSTTGLLFIAILACFGCDRDAENPGEVAEPTSQVLVPSDLPSAPEASAMNQSAAALDARDQRDLSMDKPDSPAESPDASTLYDDAAAALESGDSDLAFKLVRKARALAPDDSDVAFLTAYVLAERNRFAEAIRMLDELVAENPDARLPVLGQTADWMVHAGEWEKAENRFRSVLKEIPDATMAQRPLAQLLIRQGRRHEAASLLQQLCREGVVEPFKLRSMLRLAYPLSVDATSDTFEPIGVLGKACAEMGRGEWDAAASRLNQTSEKSATAIGLLGQIYVRQANLDALQKWMDSYEDAIDESSDARFALAFHHQANGRHRVAIADFCKAVMHDPTNAEAYAGLSRSLGEIGMEAEAKSASERSELILRTQRLAEEMGNDPAKDQSNLELMVDALFKLQRPFEAFAWQTIEIKSRQAMSAINDDQAAEEISKVNAARLERLAAGPAVASEEFLCCGVDPQKLSE